MDLTTVLRDAIKRKQNHGRTHDAQRTASDRAGRALALFLAGAVYNDPDQEGRRYLVQSQTQPDVCYPVATGWGQRCACRDWLRSSHARPELSTCKHLFAAYMAENAMRAARKHAAQLEIDLVAYETRAAEALALPHPEELHDYLASLQIGARLAIDYDNKQAAFAAKRQQEAQAALPQQIALIVRYPVSGANGDPDPAIIGPGTIVEFIVDGEQRMTKTLDPQAAERWLAANGYELWRHGWIDGSGSERRRHSTYERQAS